MLNFVSICPHPPLIIPNVGKDRIETVSDTIEALETLAEKFERQDPTTVIVVSPHAPSRPDCFVINEADPLKGNFRQFGDSSTELTFRNDRDLMNGITETATENILISREKFKLDHGTLVPLYYLTQGKPDPKIVSLAYSGLSLEKHFQLGKALRKAARDKNVALVASGDLSHRLSKQAPAGYSPRGEEFDQKLIELIKEKDTEGILNLDPQLVQQAGQCGYRSVVIALGALAQVDWEPEILSYQGPFGVGYLVASLI